MTDLILRALEFTKENNVKLTLRERLRQRFASPTSTDRLLRGIPLTPQQREDFHVYLDFNMKFYRLLPRVYIDNVSTLLEYFPAIATNHLWANLLRLERKYFRRPAIICHLNRCIANSR